MRGMSTVKIWYNTGMDDNVRKEKNSTIRENGKATRLRHSSMRPVVVEMKLDLKCLNKSERNNLWNITSLDKDGDFSHCLPNSSRVCILPLSGICHRSLPSAKRQIRKMES